MYNTYIPPAFHNDSVHAKPAVQGEKRDSLSPVVASQPVVAVASPVHGSPEEKKRIRDSIAAVNKALTEARKDSIQNARKLAALQKDSILAVNKALATARKDSIATARKLAAASKDSLLAAEKAIKAAARDSAELAGNKAHAPAEQPVTGGSPPAGTPGQSAKAQVPASVPVVSAVVAGPRGTGKPGVKKIREVSLKISRKIVFLDTGNDGLTDTVTVFVYFETGDSIVKKQVPTPLPAQKIAGQDSTTQKAMATRNKPGIKSPGMACAQQATDADLESLRSAILIANSEQEKIVVASGAFA